MSNPESKLEEMLKSGQKPTQADIEEALLYVLHERNALRKMAHDMGEWLAKLVKARIAKDDDGVVSTLDSFMTDHVQIMPKTDGRVH